MAFSRKFLESLGLTETQVGAVIEEHVSVTDSLKEQRDKLKGDLDALNQQIAALEADKGYKQKYEDEHAAHEAFKKKVSDEATVAQVKAAYRKLLTEEKISEKHLDAVIRATDFSGMKLDKNGKLEKEDDLRKAAKEEWSDFITTTTQRGAEVSTPPTPGKAYKTKEEILAIPDTAARQRAIAENLQLFGKG